VLGSMKGSGLKIESKLNKKIYKNWNYTFSKLKKYLITKFNLPRSTTVSPDFNDT